MLVCLESCRLLLVRNGLPSSLNRFLCIIFHDSEKYRCREMSSPTSNTRPLAERTVKLNNGICMPVIGLGTYKIVGENDIFRSVEAALKSGYRLIDTAAVYGNEKAIGKALEQFLPKYNLKREHVFLTSKLSPSDLHPQRVQKAVKQSCCNLGVDYLDLYLIHWPGASGHPADSKFNSKLREAVWQELVKLNKQGVLLSIGVSNYTIGHLTELLKNDFGVPPAVNQVEIHPHYPQHDLAAFCKQHNIAVQAYGSIGGAPGIASLTQDPLVKQVAEKLKQPVPQVLLRWALQHDFLLIPKSVNPDRIASNIELNFKIPEEDMKVLDNLPHQEKYSWDPTIIA